jgi:hypothetical protein
LRLVDDDFVPQTYRARDLSLRAVIAGVIAVLVLAGVASRIRCLAIN